MNKQLIFSFCLVFAQCAASAAGAERQIYSEDAVRHGEGVYATKRYPEAERALECAGFTNNFAPTRPSRNVVPGKDYEVIPHPAVKHAADVDLRPHVDGGGLCNYIKQPQVLQWYKANFGLSSPQGALPAVAATPVAPPAVTTQPAAAQIALPKGAERQIYSEDAVRHGEGVYATKRYPEAERALECAGFTNNFAPTRPSRNVVPGKDYEVIPHPAVKHAADVDLRPHVDGGGLCNYIKQPQVLQWYKANFGLSYADAGQGAANDKYEQVAAVMRQVFNGGDLSAGSRAVKHAADVDMPARGNTPEALRQYLNSQNGTVKNWYKANFGLSFAEAVAGTAAPAGSPQAANAPPIGAPTTAANSASLNQTSQDPRVLSCAITVSGKINAFTPKYELAVRDGKINATQKAAIDALVEKEKNLIREVRERKSVTLEQCNSADKNVTEADRLLVTALASTGQNASPAKYEQVASVMKEVFTGGDLSPNSRAVRHAADVDMPARGGSPDALKVYLNSQNGTVKNWYKANFGLSYADAGQGAANDKYEQVAAVMRQVFNGGDLSAGSRAVKHAADVDMPARGNTPEALRQYLNSQNGTVKNWYKANFGLSFAEAVAGTAAPAGSPQAANAPPIGAPTTAANSASLNQTSQDPRVLSCAITVSGKINAFTPKYELAVRDGKINATQKAAIDALVEKEKNLIREVRERKSVTLEQCNSADKNVTEADRLLVTALASTGQNASPAKYEQVASVMKEVFTGGDLSPNSRAVRHAADVDMPARGGSPDALKVYLNSQNGTVKNWYKANFGLSYADAGQGAANDKYEQVAAVMRQVFNGGDLSAGSRAVKHAADVDMPARGNTPEALRQYLNSQNGTVKNWYKANFGLSFAEAVAGTAAPAGSPQAANAPPIGAPTTAANSASLNQTSQDPRVLSCAITVSGKINAFTPKYELAVRDGKINATQKAAIDALVEKEKNLIREVRERKSVTLEQCNSADKNVTEADRLLVTALASTGQNASPAKYEQVASVMKEVFTGGDLSPNSRAVRHAADVDMPARGGSPDALKVYLNSQNGTVKNWYKANFGLSYADAGQGAANDKYEQVAAVMRQVFNGGDLSAGSRAVKHAADVDMPARGNTPEALRQYLNSQNGTVKNWYKANFGLSFAEVTAPSVIPSNAAAVPSQQGAIAKYEQVAAVMKQVFAGDLSVNSRAVKHAADVDMPARGGTPAALLVYLNSQNGTVKNWYKTNFGLSFDEAPAGPATPPTPAAPTPPVESPQAANARYEQVSSVMKQVFSGGDLSPNSRAVKLAADIDMPARGGTPEALLTYLNSQNGAVKNWYRKTFGLTVADAVDAGGETAADIPLDIDAANFSKTQDSLPPVPGAAAVVGEIRTFTDNMKQVAGAMRAEALFDSAAADQLDAVLRALRLLADGGPQSLQKLGGGGLVAFTTQQREQLAGLLRASGIAEQLRLTNAAVVAAAREVAPWSVSWKPWSSEPPLQFAALGELPLNLPAFSSGRQTINMAGLDRVQRLVMVLKIADVLRNAALFTGASSSVETWLSTSLDTIEQGIAWDRNSKVGGPTVPPNKVTPVPPKVKPGEVSKNGSGLAKKVMTPAQFRQFTKAAGKFFKAYTAVKLTTQWINTLSQLAAWLMPDKISAFYAQAGGSRTATTYNIRKDETIALTMYLVPHVTGGTVATPTGLANQVIDTVKIPFLDRIGAGSELSKRFENGAKLYAAQLGFLLAEKMLGAAAASSGPLAEWAKAQGNTYTLPEKNLTPIEMNDRRLVNLRMSPAAAPQATLDQVGNRFTVTGKKAGNVTVIGYIHNIELLRYVASGPNFSMSVTVNEDEPKPAPAVADATPKVNNKGLPINIPPGPPHYLNENERVVYRGFLDCVNDIQVALVPLPNPWIDPRIIGTNCAPK